MATVTHASHSALKGSLGPGRMAFLIATCALVMVLEGFDIQAMGIAAPVLMPLLHLDPVHAGQVFSGGQVGVVIGTLLGGALSDRLGRRAMLFWGVLVFGAFSVSTIFADDFTKLLGARAMTGLGLGLAMPNVVGMAVDYTTARNRVKTVTLIMAGMPLGGAAVSLLAALFMKNLGWQSLFMIGGAIPLVLSLAVLALPDSRAEHTPESRSGMVKALFGGGRAAPTLLLWVVFFLTSSVLYMLLNWLPSLMKLRGFSVQIGQMSSLVFNLTSVFGSLLLGFVIDRSGYKWAMPIAYAGFLAGICGMAYTSGVGPLEISTGVTGFFLLGAQYALSGVAPMYYPAAERGLGTGAALAMGRVGSITGPLLAGYVLKEGLYGLHGPEGVVIAMIPLVAVAGLAVFALTRKAQIRDH
jgi:MFS transporter, AAHS family, 3-hydroxyphenylpropionic acid transporter